MCIETYILITSSTTPTHSHTNGIGGIASWKHKASSNAFHQPRAMKTTLTKKSVTNNLDLVGAWKQIHKETNRAGVFAHSRCGVEKYVGVLHSVGMLRHIHHAPALWLRSEV